MHDNVAFLMKYVFAAFLLACFVCPLAKAAPSTGPQVVTGITPIMAPVDVPYPAVQHISVDATDVERRIVLVRESVPVAEGRELVLLFPVAS